MNRCISVVIPVFNEQDNVRFLYQELVQVLESNQFLFEIIFVDDGSQDKTVDSLSELKKNDSRLRVIRHKTNCGQSAALISGVKAAQYDWVVTLDGDGQNDPADIPLLHSLLKHSHMVVLGNRKKRDDHFIRRASSFIGNRARQFVLGDNCPDTGCSLKLFPRKAFLELPHFNHLHRFLPALFIRQGYELANIPVHHRPRKHGVSKYGIRNRLFVGLYDLIGVYWLLKRSCMAEIEHDS